MLLFWPGKKYRSVSRLDSCSVGAPIAPRNSAVISLCHSHHSSVNSIISHLFRPGRIVRASACPFDSAHLFGVIVAVHAIVFKIHFCVRYPWKGRWNTPKANQHFLFKYCVNNASNADHRKVAPEWTFSPEANIFAETPSYSGEKCNSCDSPHYSRLLAFDVLNVLRMHPLWEHQRWIVDWEKLQLQLFATL